MNSPTLRRSLAAALAAGVAAAVATVPALAATAPHHKSVVRRVMVVDNMFTPSKVTIHVGDKVDFVWSDKNFNTHNVTLDRGPKGISKKAFTSIDGARMLHFEKTFPKAGRYQFSCTIHPEMSETVTVKP